LIPGIENEVADIIDDLVITIELCPYAPELHPILTTDTTPPPHLSHVKEKSPFTGFKMDLAGFEPAASSVRFILGAVSVIHKSSLVLFRSKKRLFFGDNSLCSSYYPYRDSTVAAGCSMLQQIARIFEGHDMKQGKQVWSKELVRCEGVEVMINLKSHFPTCMLLHCSVP